MRVRVETRWPGLVAGAHHGYFAASEETRVRERIAASGASLVLVAMGMPRQELWMDRNRAALPGCSMLAVGALYRWYTGTERRGPRWLTDSGFEWLARLSIQPRRVWRRYLLGLPRFAWRVLALRLRGVRATPI